MTLVQYWNILVKRWWLVLLCFVAVGSGAYIGSKLLAPTYQASATIQITIRSSNTQADINGLLASDQLVQTESSLATTDPVLREVASHYPGLSVDQLAREVSATPQSNTQLFNITVLDRSPQRAATLANDVATTLIKQQLQSNQQGNQEAQQQLQQELTTTSNEIDTTTNQISALQAQTPPGTPVPAGTQAQIRILQTHLSALQGHYTQWQQALVQLEVSQAESGNFLLLVQNALPASRPVQPNVFLNTLEGLITGLFLGILLAILLEALDKRVRTSEVLIQILGWPVLATIWRSRSSRNEDIFNPTGPDPNIEAYRILRTNIGFSSIDEPLQSFVVTSALPQEGKTVTAANLAIFMAKSGKTTLLIDADLRRPTQHTLFGLPSNKMGLSNAVLKMSVPTNTSALLQTRLPGAAARQSLMPVPEISLTPFIHPAGISHLWVMPSGPLPPNPPELLDSKAMQNLLMVIADSGFEVVIFDTPPLLGLSDSRILASKVDGLLIVVDISRAKKNNLKQIKALLTQTGVRVLGCAINKQHRQRHSTPYYYPTDNDRGEAGQDINDVDASPASMVLSEESAPGSNDGEARSPENNAYIPTQKLGHIPHGLHKKSSDEEEISTLQDTQAGSPLNVPENDLDAGEKTIKVPRQRTV